MRRLENKNQGHDKFWEIYENGRTVTVRFGKIGDVGTVIVKKFANVEDAWEFSYKKINEKYSGGYFTVPTTDQSSQWKLRAETAEREVSRIKRLVNNE